MKFEVIGHDLHVIAITTITHSVVQGNVTRRKNAARVYAFVIVIVHTYRGTLPFTRKTRSVLYSPLHSLYDDEKKVDRKDIYTQFTITALASSFPFPDDQNRISHALTLLSSKTNA